MLLSPLRGRWLCTAVCLALLSPHLPGMLQAQAVSPAPAGDPALEAEPQDLDPKIARLIGQLGDPQFASRERAQAELARLGLRAFDALDEAQFHDDIEVALRVRFLLSNLQVNWIRDSDSPEVKRILRGYSEQSPGERKNRLDRLAALDQQSGLEVLCRLARFETDKRLSKHAALLAMHLPGAAEPSDRSRRATAIRATVGQSSRPAAQWLQAYAHTLDEPAAALEQWEQLVERELRTLAQFPQTSSREIVRDLLRWNAELLRRLEHNEQAVAVIRRMIYLLDGTREQLLEMTDWLLDHEAWTVVDELAERFPQPFHEHPLLLYRRAEAQLRQGQHELAERTAERARQLNPGQHQEHVTAGYALQERGLFDWAEGEYRYVLEDEQAELVNQMRVRFLLSEMQHDLERELAAAETLQALVDAMEKDPQVEQLLQQRVGREPGSVRSRMHYFYAQHFAAQDDRSQQIRHLERGFLGDPTDADLLIAMYRVPDADADWKQKTVEYIELAAEQFREQIQELQQQVEQAPSEAHREYGNRQLATLKNQFAWLISNTEGDYRQALRFSQESLEVRPDTAGYLDTLGRCYYALGDLENAVISQQRAVQLEPHSGQIRRQLELFLKAQAESEKNDE